MATKTKDQPEAIVDPSFSIDDKTLPQNPVAPKKGVSLEMDMAFARVSSVDSRVDLLIRAVCELGNDALGRKLNELLDSWRPDRPDGGRYA